MHVKCYDLSVLLKSVMYDLASYLVTGNIELVNIISHKLLQVRIDHITLYICTANVLQYLAALNDLRDHYRR